MIATLGSQALQTLSPEAAITVDRSRCVRHRCNRNDCRRCLDVCHAGAITWGDQGLRIDPDACTQCLGCLAACPTAALQSTEVSLPRVLSDLSLHPKPVLGCHRSSSEAHVRLPCVGLLADAEVLALLALALADGLQVDLTGCAGCPNEPVVEDLRAAHARLADFLPGHKVLLTFDRKDLEFHPPALSRRELFGVFRQRSVRAAAAVVSRFDADEPTASFGEKLLPARRRLLRKAMVGLPEADRTAVAGALFGRVAFTPACDACGSCVGVCPTGAIRPAGTEGKPPRFDTDLCVGCRSCQAFCRRQGVADDAGQPPAGRVECLSERPGASAAVGP